jgi:hypothetical protein
MKKVLILFAFVFAAGFTAAAQTKTVDVRTQAMEQTRDMMQEYRLTESSYIRLKNLNLEHLKQQNELQQRYGNDAGMLASKKQAAQAAYDHSIKEIMTAEQFAMYQQRTVQPETSLGK